ncbi:hypothetical protein FA13DRAFT_1095073 [Coprinellus micaceus]|uniref:Uncharacterized protein n=1 Tax=Coprinellus micaceus TaxID=71717 RepID=A0A4Y7SWD6_COPMI|nr:hypothetical protein FA13DRAFT_1095073 [Coprinellus micaceus]
MKISKGTSMGGATIGRESSGASLANPLDWRNLSKRRAPQRLATIYSVHRQAEIEKRLVGWLPLDVIQSFIVLRHAKRWIGIRRIAMTACSCGEATSSARETLHGLTPPHASITLVSSKRFIEPVLKKAFSKPHGKKRTDAFRPLRLLCLSILACSLSSSRRTLPSRLQPDSWENGRGSENGEALGKWVLRGSKRR